MRKYRQAAECHPNVRHYGKGKCKKCYMAEYSITRVRADYHDRFVLGKKWGITPAQYNEMLDSQGGRCAICLDPPIKKRLAVDHDHDTGEVRGLLCSKCNASRIGDTTDCLVLIRAAAYLARIKKTGIFVKCRPPTVTT